MRVCCYDNPSTLSREVWRDGELVAAYIKKLFFMKPFPVPAERFHMGANIGPWKTGQISGDPKAKEKPQ